MSTSMLTLFTVVLLCFVAFSEQTGHQSYVNSYGRCRQRCYNDNNCRGYGGYNKCECKKAIYSSIYYGIKQKCCCHKYADCVYKNYRYDCKCKDGYYGDGVNCQAISKCGTSCKTNHDCQRSSYGYGYGYGSQENCDRCQSARYSIIGHYGRSYKCCCHKWAYCTYTYGKYGCKCKYGYKGNGYYCARHQIFRPHG